MENNCMNCSSPIVENFCGHCGQKKYKRIDKKYLIDEVQYLLVHTNKGFFYSVKSIIKNPGKTAKEFIAGNRINHYKPILLAFVLSGISAFITLKALGMSDVMEQFYAQKKIKLTGMHEMLSFINSYNSFIMLLFIPIISIITYLLFRRWGNNYYEHIIMNAYIQCYFTLCCLFILYPILYFLKHSSPETFISAIFLSFVSIPIIMVWFYSQFYRDRSLGKIILKVILFLLIGLALYLLMIIIVTIVLIMVNGPEYMKQFAPPQ